MTDPIVKQTVKDIDDCEVQDKYCIMSKIFGQIPSDMLSGGVKSCILLLLKDDTFVPDLIVCGENCQEWLSRIFNMKDVKVTMTGWDLTFHNLPIKGICENDNSEIRDWKDWTDKMRLMAGEGYER